jgi:hypothetical protein
MYGRVRMQSVGFFFMFLVRILYSLISNEAHDCP